MWEASSLFSLRISKRFEVFVVLVRYCFKGMRNPPQRLIYQCQRLLNLGLGRLVRCHGPDTSTGRPRDPAPLSGAFTPFPAVIYAFAVLTVAVFFYVFHKAQS